MNRAKVLTPHVADCPGIEHVRKGWWDHSWFIQETVHRDAIGRRQAGTWRWFRLLCNTSIWRVELLGGPLTSRADDLPMFVHGHLHRDCWDLREASP